MVQTKTFRIHHAAFLGRRCVLVCMVGLRCWFVQLGLWFVMDGVLLAIVVCHGRRFVCHGMLANQFLFVFYRIFTRKFPTL